MYFGYVEGKSSTAMQSTHTAREEAVPLLLLLLRCFFSVVGAQWLLMSK